MSRCKCLREGQACSHLCGCRCCQNPHGARGTLLQETRKRKVAKGQTQRPVYKKQRGINFLQDAGEHVPHGSWNQLETFTLMCALHSVRAQKRQSACVTPHEVSVIYNKASAVCSGNMCGTAKLRAKSDKQVMQKLTCLQRHENAILACI